MAKVFNAVWMLMIAGTLCTTAKAETLTDYENKSLRVGNIVVDEAVKRRLIDEYKADQDEYKHFVSPQWGFECPEGYIRLTDYKKLAQEYPVINRNYALLVQCMKQAADIRKNHLENAKWPNVRYADIEAKIENDVKDLFSRAGIVMLEKGSYKLPDGAFVIEDDKHTMVPQQITYQQNAHTEIPTMLRDKSPNYSAHNEQTWPIYTNLKTVDLEDIVKVKKIGFRLDLKPTVYSNGEYTYMVIPNPVSYYDHWFYTSSQSALVDRKTGEKYLLNYVENLPTDTYYWVHDQSQKIIVRVFVFPALPDKVKKVDYVSGGIPNEIRLGNAGPSTNYKKIKVMRVLE